MSLLALCPYVPFPWMMPYVPFSHLPYFDIYSLESHTDYEVQGGEGAEVGEA